MYSCRRVAWLVNFLSARNFHGISIRKIASGQTLGNEMYRGGEHVHSIHNGLDDSNKSHTQGVRRKTSYEEHREKVAMSLWAVAPVVSCDSLVPASLVSCGRFQPGGL